jgi:hypothetical protein
MNRQTAKKIETKLKASELWNQQASKIENGFIRGLICPSCKESEAFTWQKNPDFIVCPRKNNCGNRTAIGELFPHLHEKFEIRYPPTEQDPNRPARKYLEERGLSHSLEALEFEYVSKPRENASCGAVMFKIDDETSNGRLLNPKQDEGKSHNTGSTAGKIWLQPGIEYGEDRPLYVCESVIDALSIIEIGHPAISTLSSNQSPNEIELPPHSELVLAFDNDLAGKGAFVNWKEKYPGARIVTPKSGDWNDFLLAHGSQASEQFEKKCEDFVFHARILTAETALIYAKIHQEYQRKIPLFFEYDGRYWSTKVGGKQGQEEVEVYPISDFTIKVDHFQVNEDIPDRPEYQFYLIVRRKEGESVKFYASATDLSTPQKVLTLFMERARASWAGNNVATQALRERILHADVPEVRQLKSTGYDKPSNCYVFQDFMISPDGTAKSPLNKLFEVAPNSKVRPFQRSTIKPKKFPLSRLVDLIFKAWGNGGLTTFVWVVTSWFVRTIKPSVSFFPFLSLSGDTQTGKTALARISNAMQCLDEEGLPMTTTNTRKGELRKISQRSGLFQAMLEGNEASKVQILDQLLPLFNEGNPLQIRAVKNHGNDTLEIPFNGAMMFVQNREPFQRKAEKERFISVSFHEENLNEKTQEAFKFLQRVPPQRIAYAFPEIMKNRMEIEGGWGEEYNKAKNEILQEIGNARISETHGLILGLSRIIFRILEQNIDLKEYVIELASAKVQQIEDEPETDADFVFSILQGEWYKERLGEAWWFKFEEKEGEVAIVAANLYEVLSSPVSTSRISSDFQTFSRSLRQHSAFKRARSVHFPEKPDNQCKPKKGGRLDRTHKAYIFCVQKSGLTP